MVANSDKLDNLRFIKEKTEICNDEKTRTIYVLNR